VHKLKKNLKPIGKKKNGINPFALMNLSILGFSFALDFRNKFIILEIGLLKALYFDPLEFLLIKNCNVPCFFIPLFEKKFSFRNRNRNCT
jgi:hypothetical protein